MDEMTYPYYAVVTFGSPTMGRIRRYYRSRDRAIDDARELYGGTLQVVRVVGCQTRSEALQADISDPYPVTWQS